MKRYFVLLCYVLGLSLCGGCFPEESLPVTVAQASILLDVRTPEEFAGWHVNTAINLPYDEIEAKASSLIPDKTITIAVYCRSGRRSAIAIQTLKSLGYTNLYDYGGTLNLQEFLNKPPKKE